MVETAVAPKSAPAPKSASVPQPLQAQQAPQPVKPIPNGALNCIGYQHSHYSVIVPAATRPDDLTDPQLWSVVSNKLRAFDIVYVIHSAEKFWGECLVRANEKSAGIEIVVLNCIELPARRAADRTVLPAHHEIIYLPALSTYEPWRTNPDGTKQKLADGYRTWEQAREHIVNHATLRKY